MTLTKKVLFIPLYQHCIEAKSIILYHGISLILKIGKFFLRHRTYFNFPWNQDILLLCSDWKQFFYWFIWFGWCSLHVGNELMYEFWMHELKVINILSNYAILYNICNFWYSYRWRQQATLNEINTSQGEVTCLQLFTLYSVASIIGIHFSILIKSVFKHSDTF